ncbi:MAG: transmembrane permease, partial [Bacteroidetes bacterium SW_10_40_5]
ALCDLKHVQKLNGWDSAKVGGYEVLVQDAGLMEQISRAINYYIDAYLNTQTIKQIFPQIFDWLGLLNINVQIILSLMAIVAAINMITALLIMILERTQMIGTIKALGASNQSVKKIFLINAMFLIGLGVLIGDLLGLGLMWLQYQYKFIELKQASYYVKEVPIYFEWFEFILINIATFVFCALMMIIPSIIVSRILPVKALRFD